MAAPFFHVLSCDRSSTNSFKKDDYEKRGSVVLGVLCLIVLTVPAMAQDPNTVIANALKAMGDLRTVEFSATGLCFFESSGSIHSTSQQNVLDYPKLRWVVWAAFSPAKH